MKFRYSEKATKFDEISIFILTLLKSSRNKKDLNGVKLPRFWCFFLLLAAEEDTENGAAVTSLSFFLFRDNFI